MGVPVPDYTDSRLVSLLAGEGRVACSVSLARGTEEGMDPDDLLCSRNARPQKVWRKGMRRFLCSGARALRRASLDGRSQKLLTPLLD